MTNDINKLLPIVKHKCEEFKSVCKIQGMDILVTGTFRTFEEQEALYSKGRTTAGTIVTNAKGGQSFHNFGVAFDCVPVVNGVTVYDNETLWAKLGHIGVSCGLEWGGNWTTFPDKPHFQYTLGYSWQDFLDKKVDLSRFEILKTDNATQREITEKSTGKTHRVLATAFGHEEVIFTTDIGDIPFTNIGNKGDLLNNNYTVKII